MEAKIRVYAKAQNRTALGIANAYLKLHPDASLEELNRVFPISLNGSNRSETIFVDVIDAPKFKTEKAGNSTFEMFFFEKPDERIKLKSGQEIVMLELWVKNDYLKIVEHAKQYGIVIADFKPTKPFEKGGFLLEELVPLAPPVVPKPEPIPEPEPEPEPKKSKLWIFVLVFVIVAAVIAYFILRSPAEEPVPEPVKPVAEEVVVAEPEEVEEVITFNSIYFDEKKSTIKKGSENDLNEALDIMTKRQEIEVLIIGHTDKRQTSKEDYNLKLSLDRANAVKEWLVSKGIDEKRLTTEGKGFNSPVASNDTPEGREKNRRIEFIIKNQ